MCRPLLTVWLLLMAPCLQLRLLHQFSPVHHSWGWDVLHSDGYTINHLHLMNTRRVCAHTKVRAHTPLLLTPCAHLPHLRQCTASPAITSLTVSCGWLLVQAGCSCRVRGEHLSWQRSYLEKRLRVRGEKMINGGVLLGLNSVWLSSNLHV